MGFLVVVLGVVVVSLLQPQLLQSVSRQWSPRIVTTRFGPVRGFVFLPKGYEGVEVFLGLPYASPPLGSLRLMPPVSGSPWSGTKMNEEPSPVCPQVVPNIKNETESLKMMPKGRLAQLKRLLPMLVANQSEDCLYLNIYVPLTVLKGEALTALAVLVFVHGDDFGWGAGHPYDPSMLTSFGNVIVVTMNYRLGILGFLNANAEGHFKSPANFALLDQIAALHWVQENIGAFGGDRANVTLMGHGKGAMFVNFLMISSAVPSGLLFHRVILMSGSALSPLTAGLTSGKALAKKFASRVRCPDEPPVTMLECLRELPLNSFVDSELWTLFGPSADDIVIEDGIRENIFRDRLSHYPLLFGVTRAEMLHAISDHDALFGMEIEKRREVLKRFIDGYFSVHRHEILAAALHEYTDWERPVQHPSSVRDETLDALADALVVAPLSKVGSLHSQSNPNSFSYLYEYQSRVSDYQQRLGCVHGEDVMYVFGVPLYFYGNEQSSSNSNNYGYGYNIRQQLGAAEDVHSNGESSALNNNKDVPGGKLLGFFTGNFTRNEVQLSQMVMLLWTNFIRTGNPNAGTLDQDESLHLEREINLGGTGGNRLFSDKLLKPKMIAWPAYDHLLKKYFTIDLKCKIKEHYRAHKLSFWLHLVPDLQKNAYGSSLAHHLVNSSAFPPKSPKISSVTIAPPRSGLVMFPPGATVLNTTTPPLSTIQMIGAPFWNHEPATDSGQFSPGSGEKAAQPLPPEESDGFQVYSTALSVTIAIGCSLLVLNLLIFATFYYQRDRRPISGSLSHSNLNRSNRELGGSTRLYSSSQRSYNSTNGDYEKSAMVRRAENGQILQYATTGANSSSAQEDSDEFGFTSPVVTSKTLGQRKTNANNYSLAEDEMRV